MLCQWQMIRLYGSVSARVRYFSGDYQLHQNNPVHLRSSSHRKFDSEHWTSHRYDFRRRTYIYLFKAELPRAVGVLRKVKPLLQLGLLADSHLWTR